MKSFRISQSITDRKDTSLKYYFREVSKLPMLTEKDEIRLAKKIRKGDSEALEKLIKGNLRFVISVAKQYQYKGLDLVDLIQEGNLGLAEAASRYNEAKGCKFISYAVWWIRQSILKAISDQCRTVRIPINQLINISKVNKASEKFEQENNRMPSEVELEDLTDLDNKKIKSVTSSKYSTVSLESPFKNEDVSCLLDVMPNDNAPLDDDVINESTSNLLDRIINKLPNRESDVIRLSFGINVQQMNNEEIANRFGICSERIRQIQNRALKTLKDRYGKELSVLL